MRMKNRIRGNNLGVTLVETLIAFLLVCVAIAMLSSCIILAINTISKSREATKITQDTIKEFWINGNPTETGKEITLKFSDNHHNSGNLIMNVNKYEINEIDIYEFVNKSETENSDGE